MKNTLDLSQKEFKVLLDRTTELVLKQFEDIYNRKGYHNYSQSEVESWFNEPLPREGLDNGILLDYVEEKVLNTATGNIGPHMYAYVMAGGNQIGIIAEMLAATINQNIAKWHLAPAINEIEKRIVQWSSELIGFGESVGGVLVGSGSSANLDGLTVARNIFFEKSDIRNRGLFAVKPFTVYCSTETHSCIDKSVQILGIGSDQLKKININDDFTIDLSALEARIQKDIENGLLPFCIIGNAGTVNTGAIDDLAGLSEIAKKHNLWFHIDGAYGALASSLENKKHLYSGIKLADSIALDFHKWLYQPFEVGCLLVKNWDLLKRTYFTQASYLNNNPDDSDGKLDFNQHHFQLSRNAKALKVWMSIKSYGFVKIKTMIQKDIELTDYLSEQIRQSNDFEIKAASELAICCFRYKGTMKDNRDIIELNQKLVPALEEDGRVFITGTKLHGEFVLRACLINHRKDRKSVDYLLNVIRDVADNLV
jgi:glutamate/tyrosine decarboxylase-like PLP-dependent enzyme